MSKSRLVIVLSTFAVIVFLIMNRYFLGQQPLRKVDELETRKPSVEAEVESVDSESKDSVLYEEGPVETTEASVYSSGKPVDNRDHFDYTKFDETLSVLLDRGDYKTAARLVLRKSEKTTSSIDENNFAERLDAHYAFLLENVNKEPRLLESFELTEEILLRSLEKNDLVKADEMVNSLRQNSFEEVDGKLSCYQARVDIKDEAANEGSIEDLINKCPDANIVLGLVIDYVSRIYRYEGKELANRKYENLRKIHPHLDEGPLFEKDRPEVWPANSTE